MNTLKAYKTINFILLPFTCLLGMATLLTLLMGLTNMAVLFQGAISSLVVIYLILSFVFLIKVIYQNKTCQPSLWRWIRTTGLITFLFALNILFGCFIFLFKPMALSNAMSQIQDLQKEIPQFDANIISGMIKIVLYVMIFFSTTLIIHYFETMKFLKIYSSAFNGNKQQ